VAQPLRRYHFPAAVYLGTRAVRCPDRFYT
jgi:hypothetical protein